MSVSLKAAAIMAVVAGAIAIPAVALAQNEQAPDDWKTYVCTHSDGDSEGCENFTNVYIKEWRTPDNKATCYVASNKAYYEYDASVAISCIKD